MLILLIDSVLFVGAFSSVCRYTQSRKSIQHILPTPSARFASTLISVPQETWCTRSVRLFPSDLSVFFFRHSLVQILFLESFTKSCQFFILMLTSHPFSQRHRIYLLHMCSENIRLFSPPSFCKNFQYAPSKTSGCRPHKLDRSTAQIGLQLFLVSRWAVASILVRV